MYIHKKSVEFLILNKHLEAAEMAVFHAARENFRFIYSWKAFLCIRIVFQMFSCLSEI